MKTTTIEGLTIHRFSEGEEMPAHLLGRSPGKLFILSPVTDEHILAHVECTKLYGDERGADLAAAAHTVVVVPMDDQFIYGGALVKPAEACVMRRERSIRARRAAAKVAQVPIPGLLELSHTRRR